MPEVRIHDSIHDIGRARWDSCCPDALEGFDYLAAVEASGLPGFDWRYITIEESGEPRVVAPAFFTDYALDTTLADFGRRAIDAIRRIAPRAFILKLGAIGSPCTETAGVCFHPAVPPAERVTLLRLAIDAFGGEAVRAGCGLIAIKDAPEIDTDLWDAAVEPLGLKKAVGLPTARLDIDFADVDAYLARLSSGTRKDMRRKLKSLASIEIKVQAEIDDIAERVLELYRMTRSRSDMQFEDLTQAYFTGVLKQMQGRSLCVTYRDRHDGSLLAANLLIHDDAILLDKFFCMDGKRGRDHNLYFVSWFTNVRLCLEHEWKVYQSGQAGYVNKLRLGSRVLWRFHVLPAPQPVGEPPAWMGCTVALQRSAGGRMSATPKASLERTGQSRLRWIVILPAVPVLGLGYQFCAEKVAMATAGAPVGLPWLIKVLAQPWTGLLILLEIASFAAWMTVLSRLPVSIAFSLTAVSYALVVALGWVVFHEPVRALEIVGAIAILAGVFMVGGGRGGD